MESLRFAAQISTPAARPSQRASRGLGANRVGFRISAQADAAEPDLSVTVNGLKMPNPFVIGSGPPGTNYTVMKRAFDEGWGAVIAKTVSLDASKVVNDMLDYEPGQTGRPKGRLSVGKNVERIQTVEGRVSR